MKKFPKVMMLAAFSLMGMAGLDKGSALFNHQLAYDQCIHGVCNEFHVGVEEGLFKHKAHSLCKERYCGLACNEAGGTIKTDSRPEPFCAGPGQSIREDLSL